MSGIVTALAWALAAVLAWAGAGKARRPARTAASFAGLGLPMPAALARLVPAAELVTAALLLSRPVVGGSLALLLLSAFTLLLGGRLRGGGTVHCACFGSARAEPLTSAALVRNVLLAVVALGVALTPTAPARPPLEALLAAGAAVAVGAVGVALWDLRARIGRLWDNTVPAGPEGLR